MVVNRNQSLIRAAAKLEAEKIAKKAAPAEALATPTSDDISLLRGNPALAPQFDEQFGAGASAEILSKGKKK
jgi:hypothetical protein